MRQMVGGQLWLLAPHMRMKGVSIGHRASLLTELVLPFKTTCASWLRGPCPIGLSSVRVSFRHTHICSHILAISWNLSLVQGHVIHRLDLIIQVGHIPLAFLHMQVWQVWWKAKILLWWLAIG